MNYGTPAPYKGDVAKLSDEELVKLQSHKNDWFVRHARRVLQERAAAGTLKPETAPSLAKMYESAETIPLKLRALWALSAVNAAPADFLMNQLTHADDNIRSWAIRLLADESAAIEKALDKFKMLAANDPSAMVRLHLASALQKVAPEKALADTRSVAHPRARRH